MITVKQFFVFIEETPPPSASKYLLNRPIGNLRLHQVTAIAEEMGYDPVDLVCEMAARRCRQCGCTDYDCSKCIEKTGEACHWVEANLCSACVPNTKKKKK